MANDDADAIDLEPTTAPFDPVVDRRPKMPEPLPVKLAAVRDMRAVGIAGLESELDAFWSGILLFERVPHDQEPLAYDAENFRLIFDVVEAPGPRDDYRPIGVEVLSLVQTREKLDDAEIEYTMERGIILGHQQVVVQDPAGNWVAIFERKPLF